MPGALEPETDETKPETKRQSTTVYELPSLFQLIELSRLPFLLHSLLKCSVISSIPKLPDEAFDLSSVAEENQVDADALFRIFRALSAYGIFKETSPKHFCHSSLSLALGPESSTLSEYVVTVMSKEYILPLLELEYSLKTGHPSFPLNFHFEQFSQYIAVHNETDIAKLIRKRLAHFNGNTAKFLTKLYKTSKSRAGICEIGGGVEGILPQMPGSIQNISFVLGMVTGDQCVHDFLDTHLQIKSGEPSARHGRLTYIGVLELGKWEVDVLPDGIRVFLLKNVLTQCGEDQIQAILANITKYAKVREHCDTVWVIENVLPERAPGVEGSVYLKDITNLVLEGGKMRTVSEITDLLEGEGLRVQRVDVITPKRREFLFTCSI